MDIEYKRQLITDDDLKGTFKFIMEENPHEFTPDVWIKKIKADPSILQILINHINNKKVATSTMLLHLKPEDHNVLKNFILKYKKKIHLRDFYSYHVLLEVITKSPFNYYNKFFQMFHQDYPHDSQDLTIYGFLFDDNISTQKKLSLIKYFSIYIPITCDQNQMDIIERIQNPQILKMFLLKQNIKFNWYKLFRKDLTEQQYYTILTAYNSCKKYRAILTPYQEMKRKYSQMVPDEYQEIAKRLLEQSWKQSPLEMYRREYLNTFPTYKNP